LVLTNSATVCVPKFLGVDACIHDGFVSFQNFKRKVSLDFLYYYFDFARPYVVQKHKQGVTQVNLNIEIVNGFEVPLPPLAEQERIVAKIEELFSELDAGIESLKTAAQQLKTYRQAVLKWAFEKSKNFRVIKLEDCCEFITKGTTPSKNELFEGTGEIPFIKVYNLTFDGSLDFSVNPTFVTNETHNNFLNRSKVFPGDVLMNIVGPPLGKVSIVPNTYNEWNINQAIARFRCKNILLNRYLFHFLTSENTIRQYSNKSKATAGQFNLTLEICRNILIPLCSLEEQQRIVEEIESRLSVCDKLQETINLSLAQAESLRQSILKRAFEGKLVAQEEIAYQPKKPYFYQVQIMAFMLVYFRRRGFHFAEMVSAKNAYLLHKIYGIPFYKEYTRWHLGPYSPEIKKVINNKNFFKIAQGIEVLDEEKLFKYANPYRQKIEEGVNELADIFLTFHPKKRSHEIELLATVCKVIEDIQTTDLQPVRQSMEDWKIDLEDKRFRNKAEKFNEEETAKCVAFIQQKGWDKKLIKWKPI
jgi:type I restriction enzyme, S subunit